MPPYRARIQWLEPAIHALSFYANDVLFYADEMSINSMEWHENGPEAPAPIALAKGCIHAQ
ncbi:MAG: hypothetical protein GY856_40910 [bacterium]|nr:hypothetical protein [bacterium]